MSVGSSSPPPQTAVFEADTQEPAGEPNAAAPTPDACPLCGAPLHPDQEWCLRCGAAARTRLAMSSNWKAPIIAVGVVAALSLAVLAASLVALGGNFGGTTRTSVTTVVGTAPSTPAPAGTTPAPAASAPNTATTGTPASTTPAHIGTATSPATHSTTSPATHSTTTPAPTRAGSSRARAIEKELRGLERLPTPKSPAARRQLAEIEEHLRDRLRTIK